MVADYIALACRNALAGIADINAQKCKRPFGPLGYVNANAFFAESLDLRDQSFPYFGEMILNPDSNNLHLGPRPFLVIICLAH